MACWSILVDSGEPFLWEKPTYSGHTTCLRKPVTCTEDTEQGPNSYDYWVNGLAQQLYIPILGMFKN